MRFMMESESKQIDRLVRDLDWNLLHSFMVIVQEGSITAAANRMRLRQPTVSQALKRLEMRLEKQLIDRSPSTFRVTPAGQHLYRECVEIYGSIARATTLTRNISDELSGRIRISFNSQVVCPLFDQVLADFHIQHPKVTFQISVMPSIEVVNSVLDKSASFGIGLVHEKNPKLDHVMIYREFFGFYCGPTHPLFGKEDLSLQDLQGYTTVSYQTDQFSDALRPLAIFRAQHDLDEHIVGISSNLIEVKRMAIAGLGIAPLPIHAVMSDLEAGDLWRLPPYDNPPACDVFLSWHPEARMNRAETAFLANLRQAIEDLPEAERIYDQF